MIEIKNLFKSYKNKPVLCGINRKLEAGHIMGILGHNGAGKSTLIRCLSGEEAFDGQVMFNHKDILDVYRSNPQAIAIVPDSPFIYPYLGGWDFVRFVIEFKGIDPERLLPNVESYFRRFDIWEAKDLLCSEYSLGMKKKVYLIAQIVGEPKLLLCDEPTNGLDVTSIIELRKTFRHLAQGGCTILVTSHNLGFLEKICDSILLLKCGAEPTYFVDVEEMDLEETFIKSFEPVEQSGQQ